MSEVKIIIPSKGRPKLAGRLEPRVPESIVCVAESEADEYRKYCKNVQTHPDDIIGVSPVRQWILDNYDGIVVMMDDDIDYLGCYTDVTYRRIKSGDNWIRIIENCAQMAVDAGANVFGFSQTCDVRKYQPFRPFMLNTWIGSVIGVVGREIQFDRNLWLRADADFCLQNLLKYRIVWLDNRYGFVGDRLKTVGGNSSHRTKERDDNEIQYLRGKWGKYIKFSDGKTTKGLSLNVKRAFDTMTLL